MRTVNYKITTKNLEVFETTSLEVAEELVTKYPHSTMEVDLVEVKKATPQMSATRLEWLKSGKKPLHSYKGGVMV